jgi:hypothetical protein
MSTKLKERLEEKATPRTSKGWRNLWQYNWEGDYSCSTCSTYHFMRDSQIDISHCQAFSSKREAEEAAQEEMKRDEDYAQSPAGLRRNYIPKTYLGAQEILD